MAGFDLSQTKARVPLQDRKVDRRSGIVPEIDTRQRGRQIYGEMRNARRGNGSGEALLEALGMVQDAGKDIQGYINKADEKKQEELAGKGALDQAAGQVDEEMVRKSRGYREAVALGRATSGWAQHKAQADTDFLTFLENDPSQQSLDVAERRAAAAAFIEKRYFGDFAIDPETGKPKDFGAPGAVRSIIEQIGRNRPALLEAANARITERFHGEALTHFTNHIRETAPDGSFDLVKAMALLPPDIPQEVVTKTYLETASVLASELEREGDHLKAVAVIDQALGYAAASGLTEEAPAVDPLAPLPDGTVPPPPPPAPQTVQQKVGRITIAADKLASLVMHTESRGNPNAVSPKGARGTMQTMPFTLKAPGFGVRPARDNSPAEMERVGKDYLKAMTRRYGGSIPLALAAYNAGPGMVDDWLNGTNKTGKNPSKLKLPDPRQRGVSEHSFWAGIPFSETKNYVREITANAGQPIATGGEAADAIAEGNPDFVTPSAGPSFEERAKAPQPRIIPELTGRFAMTASQRNQLLQLRSTIVSRGEGYEAQKKREQVEELENGWAMRLVGQGPPLTTEEITRAVADGRVDGRTGAKWLESNQARIRAEEAHVRSLQQEADRELAKNREEQASSIIHGYLADVVSGKMSPSQGQNKLMTDLAKISDPMVAYAVLQSAPAMFRGVEGARMDTPQARSFGTDMDGAESGLINSLSGRSLRIGNPPRNLTPDQAHGVIKQWVDAERVRGAQMLRDTGKAPDRNEIRNRLMQRLNSTFPPRQVQQAQRRD